MGEKGGYAPVEGDVVDPLQQAVGSGFGVAGVMVGPEGIDAGAVFEIPKSARVVAFESPGAEASLHGKVVERGVEEGDVFVGGKLHRDMIDNAVVGGGIDVEAVAATAAFSVTEAEIADDAVVARDAHGAVVEADAIAWGGLTRDGDVVLHDAETAVTDINVSADRKDDGATGGRRVVYTILQRPRAVLVEIGDDIDITTSTTLGMAPETLCSREGGNLRKEGSGEEKEESQCFHVDPKNFG